MMKPLTVKELIEKLQECDLEMEVYFNYNETLEPCTKVVEDLKYLVQPHNLTHAELQESSVQKVILIDSEPS